jgi:hypothetical protein
VLPAQGVTFTVYRDVTQCRVFNGLGVSEEPVFFPPQGKVETAVPPPPLPESTGRHFPEATRRCMLFFVIFFLRFVFKIILV